MAKQYEYLYEVNATFITQNNTMVIPSSDIVSVSFMHQYNTASYPIIRLRLYADIDLYWKLNENHNDISVNLCFDGNIYELLSDSENNETTKLIQSGNSISLQLNAYIEYKNDASSIYDKYNASKEKENNLNENIKVPIEMYCYPAQFIHNTKQVVNSVYKDMSINSVIDLIAENTDVAINKDKLYMGNNDKYEQILLPNLNVVDSLAFIDLNYGLSNKGAMLYYNMQNECFDIQDSDTSDVHPNIDMISVLVRDKDSISTINGIDPYWSNNTLFNGIVSAENVSIKTESDINKVIQSEEICAYNMDTMNMTSAEFQNLFKEYKENPDIARSLSNINIPNILHFHENKNIAQYSIARIEETITNVDVSGNGWGLITGIPFIILQFEDPMRTVNLPSVFRPIFINQTLENTGGSTFTISTTMRLCSN